MILQIETRQLGGGVTVLVFTGRITIGRESQRIETMVNELVAQDRKKLIFDLSGVEYIDSTGIGIIAFTSATLNQAGGGLRVSGARGKVEHVFEAMRLANIVPCYPNVDAALKAFEPG
jgi:anti-sigma B factor antagonist